MPCACKDRVKPEVARFSIPEPQMSGVYAIAGAESTEPYTGKYMSKSALIVGFGTPCERVFAGNQKRAARAAKKECGVRTHLFAVPASQLPADVGYQLFGS